MKASKSDKNPNVFLTLEQLLKFELISTIINLGSGKQKSNSVLSGRYASRLRGRGLDFEESRPYVLGDDIRKIDWNVTAKIGKTHTKVFTEEKEKPAFIYVDQSASMGFGSTKKTKSVVAGELASILAHKIKKGGDRVGGMVNSGKTYEVVTPKRDPRNIIYFLQKIVEANHKIYQPEPFEFESTLTEIISKINNIVTHDYVVYIISDFRRYSASVVQYLSQLALHNDLVLIKVYDELEEHIPQEKLTITNTKYQINLNGKNKKLNNTLNKAFEYDYKNFQSELEKYQINIFKINTHEPVEDQLIEVFSNYNTNAAR
ncbi:DUF58 domain-containing protein [Pseudotamlana agarivorans]|uniref:DUF58 domain-containing protein n=1 Tax=Pseudotamlana agarivorans TaxID=481183 RepID=UPI00082F3917|nr:DUF58 domain-containing protein [Tamlana agarivorans]